MTPSATVSDLLLGGSQLVRVIPAEIAKDASISAARFFFTGGSLEI
jgi:hypothetical protein